MTPHSSTLPQECLSLRNLSSTHTILCDLRSTSLYWLKKWGEVSRWVSISHRSTMNGLGLLQFSALMPQA